MFVFGRPLAAPGQRRYAPASVMRVHDRKKWMIAVCGRAIMALPTRGDQPMIVEAAKHRHVRRGRKPARP